LPVTWFLGYYGFGTGRLGQCCRRIHQPTIPSSIFLRIQLSGLTAAQVVCLIGNVRT
jgi:hypothetical protein